MLTFAVGASMDPPPDSRISVPNPSFAVALGLVQFRRLEGPSTVVFDLSCHLHRFELSPGRRPGQLWRLSLSAYCAGVRKLGRGVHGCRLRCGCMTPVSVVLIVRGSAKFGNPSDLKAKTPRIRHVHLIGPQCGPIFGPVLGGALAETNYRWPFRFLGNSSSYP